MTTVRHFPCILCEKRTKPQERRLLSGDNNKPLRKYLFKTFFVSVHDGDVLCGKCRRVYYTDCSQKLECTSYISSIYLELPPIKQYILVLENINTGRLIFLFYQCVSSWGQLTKY